MSTTNPALVAQVRELADRLEAAEGVAEFHYHEEHKSIRDLLGQLRTDVPPSSGWVEVTLTLVIREPQTQTEVALGGPESRPSSPQPS